MKETAREMMRTIKEVYQDPTVWSFAFLEARFSSEGSMFLWMFRVALQDGTSESLQLSDDLSLMLDDLWELQKGTIMNQWYGIKFTITPDGECQTDFNFNSECIADPHFIDDLRSKQRREKKRTELFVS